MVTRSIVTVVLHEYVNYDTTSYPELWSLSGVINDDSLNSDQEEAPIPSRELSVWPTHCLFISGVVKSSLPVSVVWY